MPRNASLATRLKLYCTALAVVCTMAAHSALAQTVIVVRHGAKLDASADPVLSPEGQAQALRLANMLATANIRAIYTTQYKRTMLQAAPTAKLLGLTPVTIPGKDTDTLIAKIRAHAKDEVVLVVGHSNTVPEILKGLGHAPAVTVREEDFDNLFIVTMRASGPPTVLNLRY